VTIDLDAEWTPEIVADRLIAAGRWVVSCGGPVGPRAPRSLHFNFIASALDPKEFDREFGGPPEIADPDDIRRARFGISPGRVSAHEHALTWPSVYLTELPGPATVLKVWLRCKVYRRPFDESCRARGWARPTAYRARGRALGAIAMGLTRDRCPSE